jgi:hypothetical protein
MRYIIISFLIFILLIFIILLSKESYDGRISNISYIEDCADIASSIYGISSFIYNASNKKCYVSKTPQIKPPLPSAYSFESNPNNLMCNKELFMRSESDISDSTFIGNRLYTCYDKDNYDSLVYFQKNKKMKTIDKTDINKLSYTRHKFNKVVLPTSKSELKDLNVTIDKQNNLLIN